MTDFLSSAQVTRLIKAVGAKRTVLIQGEFGIGKSSVFHTLAADPSFTHYHRAMVDCTNLSDGSVWMPDIDRSRGISRELPNERFGVSEENHAGTLSPKPVLVCLDEMAKARQFVKDTLAPLVYERRLGGYGLPEGSIVFATTNLADEGLGDSMLQHMRNRLVMVNMRKPTKDEWVNDFAVPRALSPEVIAAVEMYPMVFDSFTDYRPGGKYAGKLQRKENPYISDPSDAGQEQVVTPRSLHAASDLVRTRGIVDDVTLQHALAGTVGAAFASNIMSMIRFGDQLPTYDRVIADPEGAPLPSNATCCIVQVSQFKTQANTKEEAEQVSTYVARMREELKSLFVNSIVNSSRLDRFAMSKTFNQLMLENRHFLGV